MSVVPVEQRKRHRHLKRYIRRQMGINNPSRYRINNTNVILWKDREDEYRRLYNRLGEEEKKKEKRRIELNKKEIGKRQGLGYTQRQDIPFEKENMACKNSALYYEIKMTNRILDKDIEYKRRGLNKYAVTIILEYTRKLDKNKDRVVQKLRRRLYKIQKFGVPLVFHVEPGLREENGEYYWVLSAHGIIWAKDMRWKNRLKQNCFKRQVWVSRLESFEDLFRYSRYCFKNATFYKVKQNSKMYSVHKMPTDRTKELLDWWGQYHNHQLTISRI